MGWRKVSYYVYSLTEKQKRKTQSMLIMTSVPVFVIIAASYFGYYHFGISDVLDGVSIMTVCTFGWFLGRILSDSLFREVKQARKSYQEVNNESTQWGLMIYYCQFWAPLGFIYGL